MNALIRRKISREIENHKDSVLLKTQGLLCSGPQVTSSVVSMFVCHEGKSIDPNDSLVELNHIPTNISSWK